MVTARMKERRDSSLNCWDWAGPSPHCRSSYVSSPPCSCAPHCSSCGPPAWPGWGTSSYTWCTSTCHHNMSTLGQLNTLTQLTRAFSPIPALGSSSAYPGRCPRSVSSSWPVCWSDSQHSHTGDCGYSPTQEVRDSPGGAELWLTEILAVVWRPGQPGHQVPAGGGEGRTERCWGSNLACWPLWGRDRSCGS